MSELEYRKRKAKRFYIAGCIFIAIWIIWNLTIWKTNPFEYIFLGAAAFCWFVCERNIGWIKGYQARDKE